MIHPLFIFAPWLLALLGYLAEGADGLRTVAFTWLLAAPAAAIIIVRAYHEPR